MMKKFLVVLTVVMLSSLAAVAQTAPALSCVDGVTSFPHPSAEVSWNPSSNGVAYNLYRSPATSSGAIDTSVPPTKLNTSPITAKTCTDATVVLGKTYFYTVTALSSLGDESAPDTAASVIFPPRPDPPSGTKATKH
jgi:hypothetical protein